MDRIAAIGRQVAVGAVVIALLYCVSFTISSPGPRKADRDDWCNGFRFGWQHEACSRMQSCQALVPACPAKIPLVTEPSLSAGVQAGMLAAQDYLGVAEQRPAPDPSDGIHGY